MQPRKIARQRHLRTRQRRSGAGGSGSLGQRDSVKLTLENNPLPFLDEALAMLAAVGGCSRLISRAGGSQSVVRSPALTADVEPAPARTRSGLRLESSELIILSP